jgi:ubiquinone/menaquinone biosynthesis C-methylase UbiE
MQLVRKQLWGYNICMQISPEKNVDELGFIPGQTVADFGSGSGHYALLLARVVGRNGRIIAIDINKDVLTKVVREAEEESLSNIEIVWGDVEKAEGTGLRDQSFDGVLASNLLSLVEDKVEVIWEAKRVLKSGGRLCVIDGKNKLEVDKLRNMIERENFVFERQFPAGIDHFGLIFKKI